MSILSDFEDRIGGAIEGVFAGVFRSRVQPAELARACAKEMDRRRIVGIGKVLAPTLYSVLISQGDADQLGGFTGTLSGELETYLAAHARDKGYEMVTAPVVRFHVDDELKLGRYEVIGELMTAQEIESEFGANGFFDPNAGESATVEEDELDSFAEEPVGVPEDIYPIGTVTPNRSTERNFDAAPAAGSFATVAVPGHEHDIALHGERMIAGRLMSCDIVIHDANASREHCAFEREGAGWAIVDLRSTNGTLLNGERIERVRLADGDVITVGTTALVYHETRG